MDVRRTARIMVIIGMLGGIPTAGVALEPRGGVDDLPSVGTAAPARSTPWISSSLPAPVRSRIETSFQVASQRIVEAPECGALFADLGADGIETLASTLYYAASAAQEKKVCGGAWGYTTVGSAPTFLCRKFSRISERRGALILIHEALHHAGLGEWPNDSKGLTSKAINNLVEDACGL